MVRLILALFVIVIFKDFAYAEAVGPFTICGTIRKISAQTIEVQTEGETLIVPREFVPKEKLKSKSQIVINLNDEQIIEVQVK